MEVESAEMKLLVPPQAARRSVRVRAYQVVGVRRRRFLGEKVVYVSQALNKWCELDVTDVVRNWVAGDRNLGIELQCPDCAGGLEPLRASINALVKVSELRNGTNDSKNPLAPVLRRKSNLKCNICKYVEVNHFCLHETVKSYNN